MTNSIAEEIGRIPMSPFLAATLSRAASYADSQGHLQVTIEHLLLALSEDPEATVVLRASNIDLGRLAADVSAHLGRIEERGINGASREVVISQDLKRILEAAAAAASQGRRREINGAIVLAAVIGEGRSVAAHMLRAQGMTFETAIKALQQLQNAPMPQAPQAAPAPRGPAANSTDEILASARERVQTRTAPPQPRETTAPPAPPSAEPPRPTLSIDPQLPPAAPPMRAPQDPGPQPQSYEPRWEPAVPRTQPPAQPNSAGPLPQLQPTSDQTQFEDIAASIRSTGGPPPVPDQWAPRTAPPAAPPQQRPPARMPPPIPPAAATPPMPPSGPRTGPPQGAFPPPSAPAQFPPGSGGGPAMQPPAAPPWADAANAPPPQGQLPPRPRGTAAVNAGVRTQPAMAPQQAQQPDPRRRSGPLVQSGQLVENIPRAMRAGITMIVEARIAKAEVKAIAEGLQGGGAVHRHEVLVSKAMTVRLRAPDGGFTIETASPETQWIENVLGVMSDDYASWRWAITPLVRGKRRLQLVVSARTVGADGLAAETALPDQVIEVKVSINYAKTAKRWAGWIAAAIFGGVLARFGETAFVLLAPLISKLSG